MLKTSVININNTDFMEPEKLRELQLTRLKNVVNAAYSQIEFVRRRMDENLVKPDDIESLADITSLPFTDREDLQGDTFTSELKDVALLQANGADGIQTASVYTRGDLDIWAEAMKRCLDCAGITRRDKVFNAYPGSEYGIRNALRAVGATLIDVSANKSTKNIINIIRQFKASAVCCTPGYFNYLLEQAMEMGVTAYDLNLRIGIFGAEPWTGEMRQRIETVSGIKTCDIYGVPELINPGIAVECECRNGLHILEDLFYPEIVDRESGEPVSDGELGELVLTPLMANAMPFLRYRTGDITRFVSGECGCGRKLRRIERISTRRDDMLSVRGVNIYPSRIEAALMSVEGTLPYYNIVLYSENGMDNIEVNVEITEAVFSDRVRSLEAFQNKLVNAIEQNLGLRVRLKLVAPGSIQRSGGKAKHLIDRRFVH
jgi:phenylacetate-CoA ligase